ncbi:MAG: ABC transporter permease, partial [Phycisphaerales bacterium]
MILRQTGAMFVDAYRELNYKKMFWITLALSMVVVAAIACIGINDQGFTVFKWTFPIELLNTSIIEKSAFYRFVFYTFGFGIWLTWAATILAIISTASIIPDFVSSGSIELSLSKPIGRLRLFFTKYLTGLTFVALQVAVFALGAFIVIGIRGGSWDLRMFWSIPLVLLFFSYLYCISALVGILTRSTVAAILVTVLLWAVIWMAHMVESGWLLQTRVQYDVAVQL